MQHMNFDHGFLTEKYPYREGAFYLGKNRNGQDVGYLSERHAITIAGAGSGKGATVIIPNLKRWPHNALVIDPKGEAAEQTWRDREAMGQAVHVLDPFDVADVPEHLKARFNPLDAIDLKSKTAREDIKVLADGLVMRHDPRSAHWDDGALDVLAGFMALAVTSDDPAKRTLPAMRQLFDPANLNDSIDRMENRVGVGNLMKAAAGKLKHSGTEATHFISGATSNTSWLDSEAIADTIQGSTFQLSDLKEKPCTVFLVLPAHLISEHGRFLRLFVRAALDAMAKGGTKGGRRCLFLLDEFYSLGYIDEIAKAAGLMRGYGVQLWPILQDLGQLVKLYDQEGAETFFGNSDVHQFFGNSDGMTLEYIARQIGVTRGDWGEKSGIPKLSPQEIREFVGKGRNDIVARRSICFLTGSSVIAPTPAPYFGSQNTGFFNGEDTPLSASFESRQAIITACVLALIPAYFIASDADANGENIGWIGWVYTWMICITVAYLGLKGMRILTRRY